MLDVASMLRVALIVGSTRPNRFADTPAKWIAAGAAEAGRFQIGCPGYA